MAFKTPGVYAQELSSFPPSVQEVETSVPAFIGYTEKADLRLQPTKVTSLLEYEGLFGTSSRYLRASLDLFFANGGGRCCVVSVGDHKASPSKRDFEEGLAVLKEQDEPTMVLFPDAVLLQSAELHDLQAQALAQCHELGDRVAILDLLEKKGAVAEFRKRIGTQHLAYGAAYTPWLEPSSAKPTAVPPSGAVAGIYAQVDQRRGVWKAPANVTIRGITGPTRQIDDQEQEGLNVDPVAGKSINAIRTFAGKGTLVWGARTLAGNDNEWRYVSVRRFFNMVAESVEKSTRWAVFEPNDANTWTKVRSMIENYLTLKWRAGALQGSTPDQAYFVRVGLGETMTAQDILEGRLIVEIGMALVRPAEFILLKFAHKLAET